MTNTHSLDLESGSSQYASIADASQTGLDLPSAFTLECWLKFESLPTGTNSMSFIAKNKDTTNNRSYQLRIEWNSGNPNLNLFVSTDGTYQAGNAAVRAWKPIAGVKYHVAVSYGGGFVQFYINGQALGAAIAVTGGTPFNSAIAFGIGVMDLGGTPREFFDGLMDEVRVWSDVRSAVEIEANYGKELVGNEANLVGYWKFNNNALDETSNNNDLTLSGSPSYSTTIPFINNLKFIYTSADGNIRSDSPTTNTEGEPIYSGDLSGSTKLRALLKGDFSALTSIVVTSCKLNLVDKGTNWGSNDRTKRLYRLLRNWVENQVTWNSYSTGNAWGTAGAGNTTTDREASDIGSLSFPGVELTDQPYQISMTASAVQEWIDGAVANYGVILVTDTESQDLHEFYNSGDAQPRRPYFELEYEEITTEIKKIMGVAYANVKKVSGIPIASVKKIVGVA